MKTYLIFVDAIIASVLFFFASLTVASLVSCETASGQNAPSGVPCFEPHVDSSPHPRPQNIETAKIKVIAFDVFGTVFDFDGVERGQIRDYVKHVKSGEWSPICLPDSWKDIPAHDDSAEGIMRLRERFTVVTLSNGPMRVLVQMNKNAGIDFDAIVPIEMAKVYKPDLDAYRTVMELFHCHPSEVLMVTANPLFGDLESSKELGIQSIVIRPVGLRSVNVLGPETITELADLLGCEK